jgi:hypothetical protein
VDGGDRPSLKSVADDVGTMFPDVPDEPPEPSTSEVGRFRSWVAFFAWGQQHAGGPGPR